MDCRKRFWITVACCSLFAISSPTADAQLIQTLAGNGTAGFLGDGGPAAGAELNDPFGVAVDSAGNVYIADFSNSRVRVVNTGTNPITVANVFIPAGTIATVAGNGTAGFGGDGSAATSAMLNNPTGVAVDSAGTIYIADAANYRIRKVTAGGIISTIAGTGTLPYSGDGPALTASLIPWRLAVDQSGNLYIADVYNNGIRVINLGASPITLSGRSIQPGYIATLAGTGDFGALGDGGPAINAQLANPYGVAVDSHGTVYIGDTYNRRIRIVNTGTTPVTVATVTVQPGCIATIAGDGNYGFRSNGPALFAQFADLDGVSLDSFGNVYINDLENQRIRLVDHATGFIRTIAGTGALGYNGDGIPATTAALSYTRATAVDGAGNVYIADQQNNERIREIVAATVTPAITSSASTSLVVGTAGSFVVTTNYWPEPVLTLLGALPSGVTFVDNHDGTGTLSGTPASGSDGIYNLSLTANNSATPPIVQAFTLTVYAAGGSPATSSATFVATDIQTEGNWIGPYGTDGFAIADLQPQSIPAYAAITIQNESILTWGTSPTDPRTLQIPGSSGRVAAAWYNNQSFTIDLNFTDGQAHKFALYFMDLEFSGRIETVQVQDFSTGFPLYATTVSNFPYGQYLVLNISGHVLITIGNASGPNAILNGIFFGAASSISVAPSVAALSANQTQQFSVTGVAAQSVTWSISPVGVGSISSTGLYAAPSTIGVSQTVTITASSTNPSLSGSAAVTLSTIPLTPPAGLALWWTFDNANNSGEFITDSSGNNGTGEIYGLPVVVPGKVNQALSFNGANAYVSMNANEQTLTSFNNSLTLTAWIKTTNTGLLQTIISKYSPDGSGWGYDFRVNLGGTLELLLGANDVQSGPAKAVDTTVVTDGQWHHVAAVITIGQGVQFYVDGTPASSVSLLSAANGDETSNLVVGANLGVAQTFFTGTIDEVRVYNLPLNASQVNALYVLSGGVPVVTVTVTPQNSILTQGLNQQFFVSITNSATTAVNWTISPQVGSISPSGYYSAPATVSSPQLVTVTATLQADMSKYGSATMSVVPPVAVTLTPASVSLTQGQTQQFTATVMNASNTAVSWGLSPALGSITLAGLYSAPMTLSSPQTVTVTAYSVQDSSKYATATVTLVAPVSPPAFSSPGGTYNAAPLVTLSTTTSGASIRYTLDGSTPTQSAGLLYSGGITVSATTTIKAVAYVSGIATSPLVSATYVINSGSIGWYSGSWANRKLVAIDHTLVSGASDLSSFPVLVSLASDSNLASGAQSTGNDILFTASDGMTRLNHEIEFYNSGTGQLVAWINVPVLSHTQDTAIYLYYGNAAATNQQNPAGVWDSNFVGVWHMGETNTTSNRDSTANGDNAAKLSVTSPLPTAGQIDGAQSFNGGTDQDLVPAVNALNAYPLTISLWTKTSQKCDVSGLCVLVGKYGGNLLNGYSLHLDGGHLKSWYFANSNNYTYPGGNGIDAGVLNDNAMHYVVMVVNASGTSVYVDNQLRVSQPWTGTPAADSSPRNVYFGGNPTPGGLNYQGILDEIRISNTARSTDWIATEYNNQSVARSFYSLGGPEAGAGSVTVSTVPPGLMLTVDSASCTSPCDFQWTPGSSHTISAGSPQSGAPGTQYAFSSWSDAGAQTHSVIVPSSAVAYTATYNTQYFLTTAANPSAGGTINPPSGWYNAGSVVSVSATANPNNQFTGFSGALTGSTSPQNVTMNAPESVTANFAGSVAITLATVPTGLSLMVDGGPGSCTSPCVFQWNPGSMHTIAAPTPQAGTAGTQYVFFNWSDTGAPSHSITVPAAAAAYTANFTTQYFLTTSAGPNGTISPASGWYNSGAVVAISATPNSGYQFAGFGGGALTGTTTPQNLTMTGPFSVSASFSLSSGSWAHWKTITVDHTKVSGSSDLANFPVLVSLTSDANLAASAQANGNDILFTTSDGTTKLNHEIEFYNSGTLVAWVQIPVLSHTQDTTILMYYGNASAANQQNPAGVWDANYQGVWHMGETSGTSNRDSTTNGNNAAKISALDPSPAAGEIDGAQSFNGTSDQGDVPAAAGLNTYPLTVSMWTKTGQNCSGIGLCTLIGKYAGNSLNGYSLHLDGTHLKAWYFAGGSNYTYPGGNGIDAGAISDNALHYVAMVVNSSGTTIYVDNQVRASQSWTGTPGADSSARDLYFGGNPTPGFLNYRGLLDEVRLSNTARSSDWIATEYGNQSAPGNFYAVGPEQTSGGGGNTVTVTLSSVPSGLTITVDGSSMCTAPCSFQWTPGSMHSVSAATPQAGAAGTQYVFANWSPGGAQPLSITVPSSATVYTATFTTQYFLTTTASPSAGGTISPPSGWYSAGSVVSVSATANPNNQFFGFSGALSGTASPQNVTMSAAESVTANFAASVTITLATAPTGLSLMVDGGPGSCTSPCVFQWNPGSMHTIAASTPQAGTAGTQYVFFNWSDAGAQSHSITVPSAAAAYTANFTTQYFLTTSAGPNGSISPASGWYNSGAVVAISATPNSGYQFVGFGGGALTGTTTPQNLTMTGPFSVSASFSLSSGSWAHWKTITLDHTKVSGSSDLASFPVLVSLTSDANLAASAQANGNDILFTASDGTTKLNHEIEFYNSGTLVAWVQIPVLSHTQDTTILMYYGNASATNQQNPAGVWDANYQGVWHMGETSGTSNRDSSSNGHNAAKISASDPSPAAGAIDGAQSFNGTSDQDDVPAAAGLNTFPLTVSMWTKTGQNCSGIGLCTLIGKYAGNSLNGYSLHLDGTHLKAWYFANNSNYTYPGGNGLDAGAISDNAMHYVVMVVNSSGTTIYVDNQVRASQSWTGTPGADSSPRDLYFGGNPTPGFLNYRGLLDEVRLSNTARSSDWIATEYGNQSAPGNFYAVGPEQTSGGGNTVTITLSSVPSGLTITVDGSSMCTAPCSFQWTPGSMHSVSAATPQAGAAGTQYVFANWSPGGTQPLSITVPSSATVYTANFTTQYFLTTVANPSAGGTISPLSGWYNSQAMVQVTATANTGYQFSNFSGALSGSTPSQSVTMTGPLSVTANFSSSGGNSWYNASWAHRKLITINYNSVSGSSDLTNFPALVSLPSDSDLASVAQSNGNDLLFTAADGATKLNHEIELYTGATGQLVAWVQVPVLSHTQNTAIYVYYGNPAAVNQQNPAGVWDSSYKGVWHMGETSGTVNHDSTANADQAVKFSAGGPSPTTGQIDGAQSYSGVNDQDDVATAGGLNAYPLTISLWAKTGQNCSNAGLCALLAKYGASSANGYSLHLDGGHLKAWYFADGVDYTYPGGNGIDAGVINDNAMHYIVMVVNASGTSIYVDNTLRASQPWTGSPKADTSSRDLYFGNNPTSGGLYFKGLLDEIRISNSARSADWIATEYNNQGSPASFYNVGPQQ